MEEQRREGDLPGGCPAGEVWGTPQAGQSCPVRIALPSDWARRGYRTGGSDRTPGPKGSVEEGKPEGQRPVAQLEGA